MSRGKRKFFDLPAFFQGIFVGLFLLGAFWSGRSFGKVISISPQVVAENVCTKSSCHHPEDTDTAENCCEKNPWGWCQAEGVRCTCTGGQPHQDTDPWCDNQFQEWHCTGLHARDDWGCCDGQQGDSRCATPPSGNIWCEVEPTRIIFHTSFQNTVAVSYTSKNCSIEFPNKDQCEGAPDVCQPNLPAIQGEVNVGQGQTIVDLGGIGGDCNIFQRDVSFTANTTPPISSTCTFIDKDCSRCPAQLPTSTPRPTNTPVPTNVLRSCRQACDNSSQCQSGLECRADWCPPGQNCLTILTCVNPSCPTDDDCICQGNITPTNTPMPTLTPLPTNTPGPTSTPWPTSVPTETPTPMPTSTPSPRAPSCIGLSAYPNTGGAELTTSFTGSAVAGKDNKITHFEFHFGDHCVIQNDCLNADPGDTVEVCERDKDVGDAGSDSVTCIYQNPGKYGAWVRMRDNVGNWTDVPDECRQEIEVLGQVLGVTAPPIQPATGVPTWMTIGITALLPLGILLILI